MTRVGNSTVTEDVDFQSLLFSQATEITWKFLPPVIIVLGTFGNVMTIVMMRRMSEGQSSHTMSLYFTALAVSDLVILYFGLLRKWIQNAFYLDVLTFHEALCKVQFFIINTCKTMSPWLLVSMTIQRVFSVVWPHWKILSSSYRKFVINCIIITIIPAVINCYRVFTFIVVNKLNSSIILCHSIKDEGFMHLDWYIFPYIDIMINSLMPFGFLVVGNSVLVWKVIQSVHVARVMTAGGCDQVNSRQKKASSLTLTLITVSLVFLLLSLPSAVFLVLNPLEDVRTSQASPHWWSQRLLRCFVRNPVLHSAAGASSPPSAASYGCSDTQPPSGIATD